MNDANLPASSREIALAMLSALERSHDGMDAGTLRRRTREVIRRRTFGDRRGTEPTDRIRQRLEKTGAIARGSDGRWRLTSRGCWMLASPDAWMPGNVLPVTESEMRALRGYEALNTIATVATVLSALALALDGHHLYAASPWHGHALIVSETVDALLRTIASVGVGLIVPGIVLLVSARGSDWVALVTRRYRHAKILTDPSRER
jgi:hypothetical protein